ncbi:MAG: ABC transporter substrate-binding protein [Chloroflexi bacterium]|nr:ABC transporter substrate-binding protein [Chloroflexota bacterium]MBI4332987.1 ABC transporter substrate-binding protein [Chloroflexota bacterium]
MKRTVSATMLVLWLAILVMGCTRAGPAPAPAAPPAGRAEPAAAAGKTGWQAEWDKTVAAARQEGDLLVYMHLASEARIPIVEAFNKKFGIKMEVLTAPTPDLLTRINSEYRAGVYQVDVYIGGVSGLTTQTKPLGYLSLIEPWLVLPEVKDPKSWLNGKLPYFDQDGTAFAWLAISSPGIVYNTTMVKDGAIQSYLDLLKPEWKEKIVMSDPTVAGNAVGGMNILVEEWGLEKTRQYLKDIVRQQKTVVTRDQYQSTEWVVRGKTPIGLFSQSPTVIQFAQQGAPIATPVTREPKQMSTSNGGLAIVAKPAHPNATRLFVNWLLSREGQSVVAPVFGAPSARVDVPAESVPEIARVQPGQRYVIQSEERSKKQAEYIKDWREILAQ